MLIVRMVGSGLATKAELMNFGPEIRGGGRLVSETARTLEIPGGEGYDSVTN